MLGVVQKNGAAISRVVSAIACAQLCYMPEHDAEGAVMGMQEFLDRAESHRAEVMVCGCTKKPAAAAHLQSTLPMEVLPCCKSPASCKGAPC